MTYDCQSEPVQTFIYYSGGDKPDVYYSDLLLQTVCILPKGVLLEHY